MDIENKDYSCIFLTGLSERSGFLGVREFPLNAHTLLIFLSKLKHEWFFVPYIFYVTIELYLLSFTI